MRKLKQLTLRTEDTLGNHNCSVKDVGKKVQISSAIGNSFVEADLGLPSP
jgi:hypothetical protein